jgi:Cytochrome c.
MSEKKMRKCDNYAFTLLASSYPYLLIVLVGIGAYYAFNMGKIYQNSLPARLFDSSYIVKDYPIAEPKVVKAVDEAMLKNPTPQLIALGKEKFNTLCAACHGADGKGDGAAGAAMNPKPRNFHSNEGWTNGPDFLNMWKTLQEGIPSKGMAAYGVLPAEERVAMIQYIRTTFIAECRKIDRCRY